MALHGAHRASESKIFQRSSRCSGSGGAHRASLIKTTRSISRNRGTHIKQINSGGCAHQRALRGAERLIICLAPATRTLPASGVRRAAAPRRSSLAQTQARSHQYKLRMAAMRKAS